MQSTTEGMITGWTQFQASILRWKALICLPFYSYLGGIFAECAPLSIFCLNFN
jgi:hypothetical protein